MPTIKIKNPDGSWKYVNQPSSNADTLDGKHADEFAAASDVEALQTKVGDTSVSEQINEALSNLEIPEGFSGSWNDLTDKPFGEIETIFNGDIEGKEILQFNENLTFVKINDYILKEEDCVGKTVRMRFVSDGSVVDDSVSDMGIIDITARYGIPGFMVIPDELLDIEVPVMAVVKKPVSTEDFSLSTGTYYVIFDASNIGGVHFYTEYFSAFDNIEAIKKLDSKYLPDYLPRIETAMSDSPVVFNGDISDKEKIMIAANTYLAKVSESYVDTTTMIGSELTVFVAGYEHTDILTQDIVLDGNVAFGAEGAAVVVDNIPYVLSLPRDSIIQYSGATFEVSKGTWFFYDSNTSDISYIKCLSCLYDTQEVIHKLDSKFIDAEWMATKTKNMGDVILENTVITDSPGNGNQYKMAFVDFNKAIEGGKSYSVLWDGVEYISNSVLNGEAVFFGDPTPYGEDAEGFASTGEPFFVSSVEGGNLIIWQSGDNHTISIHEVEVIINPLPEKFLPDHLPRIEKDGEVVTVLPLAEYFNDYGVVDSYVDVNAAIANIAINPAKVYTVTLDGIKYECTPVIVDNEYALTDTNTDGWDLFSIIPLSILLGGKYGDEEGPVSIGITTTKDKPKQLEDKYLNCLTTEGIGNTLTIDNITKYPFVAIDRMNYYKVSDEVPDNFSGVVATNTSSEPSEKTLNFYNDDNGDMYASEIDIANDRTTTCLSIIFDSDTTIGGVKLLGAGIYVGLAKNLADIVPVTGYYHTIVFPNHEFKKYVVKDEYIPSPDWNASEGEGGHIENRTHYASESTKEFFPEGTYTVSDGMSAWEDDIFTTFGNQAKIEPYKKYIININGRKYECEGKIIVDSDICEYATNTFAASETSRYIPFKYIGNLAVINEVWGWELDVEDTGEPFAFFIMYDNSSELDISSYYNEPETIKFGIDVIDEDIKTIDNKYLPLLTTEKVSNTFAIGKLDRYPAVQLTDKIVLYKISDCIPSNYTELSFTSNAPGLGFENVNLSKLNTIVSDNYIRYSNNNDFKYSSIILYIAYNSNIDGIHIPGKGVYIGFNNYYSGIGISSVTFHGSDVFTKPIIKEEFLPTVDNVIIRSSTSGSTKKFKLTVDDSGTISVSELT